MSYFLIEAHSGGDVYIRLLDDVPKFLEKLTEEMSEEIFAFRPEILEKIPEEVNPIYWGRSVLIIKGDIVVPKPVNIVKKYTLD